VASAASQISDAIRTIAPIAVDRAAKVKFETGAAEAAVRACAGSEVSVLDIVLAFKMRFQFERCPTQMHPAESKFKTSGALRQT
jgi:hypothetical protein